jgi:hypothetical protein
MTTNAERAQLVEGGRPDPASFRPARPVVDFTPGTVLSAVAALSAYVAIAGALLVRFRGKFTKAGTLSFLYCRNVPDQATAYAATPAPCANLAVVANTEFSQDISPGGEAILQVTWTPDGANAAVVTFFDVMQQ